MLPNVGLFANIKLLGYIDLPGITSRPGLRRGNRWPQPPSRSDGIAGMLSQYDISKQASRDVFNTGSNSDYSSRAGFGRGDFQVREQGRVRIWQPLLERVRKCIFYD